MLLYSADTEMYCNEDNLYIAFFVKITCIQFPITSDLGSKSKSDSEIDHKLVDINSTIAKLHLQPQEEIFESTNHIFNTSLTSNLKHQKTYVLL